MSWTARHIIGLLEYSNKHALVPNIKVRSDLHPRQSGPGYYLEVAPYKITGYNFYMTEKQSSSYSQRVHVDLIWPDRSHKQIVRILDDLRVDAPDLDSIHLENLDTLLRKIEERIRQDKESREQEEAEERIQTVRLELELERKEQALQAAYRFDADSVFRQK